MRACVYFQLYHCYSPIHFTAYTTTFSKHCSFSKQKNCEPLNARAPLAALLVFALVQTNVRVSALPSPSSFPLFQLASILLQQLACTSAGFFFPINRNSSQCCIHRARCALAFFHLLFALTPLELDAVVLIDALRRRSAYRKGPPTLKAWRSHLERGEVASWRSYHGAARELHLSVCARVLGLFSLLQSITITMRIDTCPISLRSMFPTPPSSPTLSLRFFLLPYHDSLLLSKRL